MINATATKAIPPFADTQSKTKPAGSPNSPQPQDTFELSRNVAAGVAFAGGAAVAGLTFPVWGTAAAFVAGCAVGMMKAPEVFPECGILLTIPALAGALGGPVGALIATGIGATMGATVKSD